MICSTLAVAQVHKMSTPKVQTMARLAKLSTDDSLKEVSLSSWGWQMGKKLMVLVQLQRWNAIWVISNNKVSAYPMLMQESVTLYALPDN